MSKVCWILFGVAIWLLGAPPARASAPCGPSAPLIALGTEAIDQVRLGEATSYLTTTVCRSGLVLQTRVVRDSRAYTASFSSARNPRASLATLSVALRSGQVGNLKSCAVPELAGRSQDFMVVKWFGVNGRQNLFLFQRGQGSIPLVPPCSEAATALFSALRAFEVGVVSAPGVEVLDFWLNAF